MARKKVHDEEDIKDLIDNSVVVLCVFAASALCLIKAIVSFYANYDEEQAIPHEEKETPSDVRSR